MIINYLQKTISKTLMVFLLFLFCMASADHINFFDSSVAIHSNGSVTITENIALQIDAGFVSRGLYREIPLRYTSAFGINKSLLFTLISIKLNNERVPFHTEKRSNGIVLYIGDANKKLPQGKYIYTIQYVFKNIIGFFNDFDSLYLNITGNDWRLPILKTTATIGLSEFPSSQGVEAIGYTGVEGSEAQDVVIRNFDKQIRIETKDILRRYEGLTIAVKFPKGMIVEPGFFEKAKDFFKENSPIFWLLCMSFFIFFYYFYNYRKIKNSEKKFISIPLFHPPQGLDPSAIRYILHKKYDSVCFAADLVNLAVHGQITIDKDLLGYSIQKIEDQPYSSISTILLSCLSIGTSSKLSSEDSLLLRTMMNRSESKLSIDYDSTIFNSHSSIFLGGLGISICSLIAVPLFYVLHDFDLWFVLFIGIFILINGIFYWLLDRYTNVGYKVVSEINGFKTYLSVAEADKIEKIGTPPVKTPELYEKYLPYAIALDVEKAWTSQFAVVFRNLQQAGTPYITPVWLHYAGSNSLATSLGFINGIKSSVDTVIASSKTLPGSNSGFGTGGGGGRSGGGSGGGGGGAW